MRQYMVKRVSIPRKGIVVVDLWNYVENTGYEIHVCCFGKEKSVYENLRRAVGVITTINAVDELITRAKNERKDVQNR